MAITTTSRRDGPYIGNGVTTVFPFSFKVFSTADLDLITSDANGNLAELVLGTDYTATLNGNQDTTPGGTVTLANPLGIGYALVVTSDIEQLQQVILSNLGGFFPDVINSALDRVTALIQQLQNGVDQSIKLGPADNLSGTQLPSGAARAGKYLTFDANGNPTLATGLITNLFTGKVFYTSLIGCIATSIYNPVNDLLINGVLATATALSPVVLIVDQWLVTRGLRIPNTGNVSIIGFGDSTGWILDNNVQGNIITCGPNLPFDPNTPAPARIAQNITLMNFMLDGNKANNPGVTNVGPFFWGIDFINAQNINIDHVRIMHCRWFSSRFNNCGEVRITNSDFMPFDMTQMPGGDAGYGSDGIHFDGPANNIIIANCRFRTGDDGIAFNAAEGYAGDIHDAVVTNCDFTTSVSHFRFYCASGNTALHDTRRVYNIAISNCRGASPYDQFQKCMLFGDNGATNAGNTLDNISISNYEYEGNVPFLWKENIGSVVIDGFTWTPLQAPPSGAIIGFFEMAGTVPLIAKSISISNVTIRRGDGIMNPGEILGVGNGDGYSGTTQPATIDRVFMQGIQVVETGSAVRTIADLRFLFAFANPGVRIHNLIVNDIDLQYRYLVQDVAQFQSGQLANVTGNAFPFLQGGYLQGQTNPAGYGSGNTIPDSIMGEGAFWLSFTQTPAGHNISPLATRALGVVTLITQSPS